MKKILLVCAAGMSTSLLVGKMKTEASKKAIEVEIEAVAREHLEEKIYQANILLLGPQIGYLEDEITDEFGNCGIPIKVIPAVDYGMMNGKKILDATLKMMGEQNE